MSHTVTIQPSGHQFECEPEQSVLEAALKNGVALPYGCRNGACGACIGTVTAGAIEYPQDSYAEMTLQGEPSDKALLCQARACSDLAVEVREVGAAKDLQIKTLPVRVHKIERLADDVIRLFLKLPASQRLPFLAGQYLDFLLKNGQRRSFSLANAPHDDALLELHIRRVEAGFFTGFVFERLKSKDLLRIEGPHGSFHLDEDSEKPLILVAGGTGFAPIKSLVEHMVHTGDKRSIAIYWGARDRAGLYLNNLVEQWQQEHAHISYTPVLSEAEEDADWSGERGYVHEAVLRQHSDLSTYDIYCCGSPPMIQASRGAFTQQGLHPESFYFDSFEYNH